MIYDSPLARRRKNKPEGGEAQTAVRGGRLGAEKKPAETHPVPRLVPPSEISSEGEETRHVRRMAGGGGGGGGGGGRSD